MPAIRCPLFAVALSFHPAGFQLCVAFKDKLTLYNVLLDKLKPYRETVLKNCREVRYSNGGQYFAAAASINVYLYDSKRFEQLTIFQVLLST